MEKQVKLFLDFLKDDKKLSDNGKTVNIND